jgi:hypothetical protein
MCYCAASIPPGRRISASPQRLLAVAERDHGQKGDMCRRRLRLKASAAMLLGMSSARLLNFGRMNSSGSTEPPRCGIIAFVRLCFRTESPVLQPVTT